MKACAITDYGNMFGAISFYNSMKANEIQPILGYEAFLTFGNRHDRESRLQGDERPYYNLILLAKDVAGYYNLAYLASKAYTEGLYYKPRIDLEILKERSGGLIGLSAGFNGAVWHFLQQENSEKALSNAKLLEEIFGKGNFFIEIQDHGLTSERKIHKQLVELSKKGEIPLVATNDAHYLTKEDARAHEILLAIGEQRTVSASTKAESEDFYVRSAEEMWEIFGNELPNALTNTLKIADMCQVVFPKESNLTLPNFPIPSDVTCQTTDEYFEQVVMEGFENRQAKVWNSLQATGKLKYTLEDYRQRIVGKSRLSKI